MEQYLNVKLKKVLNVSMKGQYEESAGEGATLAITVPNLRQLIC